MHVVVSCYSVLFLLFYFFLTSHVFVYFVWIGCFFFFFKQKAAYEMRISDWSSDVCSSDLLEKQIVERRDPIEFIRRNAEIDRGRDAAKVRQGKVAFGSRAIDNRIDPEIELGGDGLDNAGECVVSAGRKIAQRSAAPFR